MIRRHMRTRCTVRCGRGSDMKCPHNEALEDLLDKLRATCWISHFNGVDAAAARSPLARFTNCDERGSFDYVGMRSESSYRAFWICGRCGHWTEV